MESIVSALHGVVGQTHDRAWAMPGEFYTSEGWLEVERRELFAKEWVCVGRVEELASPGDFLATDVVGEPIVVVHGRDGKLRALSNVCRHRGMLVMEGRGNAEHLMCPYHNWTYDTAGVLLRAPLVPERPDFDAAECRLPALPLEVWAGFVFVSLNEACEPLSPRLEGAAALALNYHFESMRLHYVSEEIWDTNWKCLVENFMEGYHLSPLHRETLHRINPTRLCKRYEAGDHYFGCYSGFAQHVDGAASGHPDLTDSEANTSLMIAVPPGLVIGGAGDYSSFICIQPHAVNAVRLKYGLMFYGDDWEPSAVEEAVRLGKETIAEDRRALVDVQRGVASRFYQPGPLAPADFEGTLLDFFQYLARRLLPVVDASNARLANLRGG